MNAPIGLTATAIGSVCTEFLVRAEFDALCYNIMKGLNIMDEEKEEGNMFTSLLVMIITGIWGYLLANYVNGSSKPKKKGDKEL